MLSLLALILSVAAQSAPQEGGAFKEEPRVALKVTPVSTERMFSELESACIKHDLDLQAAKDAADLSDFKYEKEEDEAFIRWTSAKGVLQWNKARPSMDGFALPQCNLTIGTAAGLSKEEWINRSKDLVARYYASPVEVLMRRGETYLQWDIKDGERRQLWIGRISGDQLSSGTQFSFQRWSAQGGAMWDRLVAVCSSGQAPEQLAELCKATGE
jgi:hypothetical protein